jgi:hypothetical protein
MRIVAAATALGLVLALSSSRLLAGMLFGVSAADPLVLSAVAALVLAVGTIAALVPAVRAARAEPSVALRE